MATSDVQVQNLTAEVLLCSICLEQYKSPVSLHCLHSFCRSCLSTHITSSCVGWDQPLGFPCPLCRVFIPAPGEIGQYSVDEWATKFPENRLLISVTDVLCKPCHEDGEEVKSNSWCKDCSEALCEECAKYHKKSRPSRQHVVISLSEWSGISRTPDTPEICEAHNGRRFELFCRKHFLPCCSVCVTTELHSSCTNFCQLEEVDENLIGPVQEKVLQSGIEKFCSKVESIIDEEKANNSCIDDVSDKHMKEITEFTTTVIQVMKRLEEEHLNELSILSKESKSKLQKSADSFEQRLLYLRYWREMLLKNMSSETTPKTKRVLSYIKLKNIHESIQRLKYTKLEICIKTRLLDQAKKLIELPRLGDISADEILDQVALNVDNFDYTNAQVNEISEFTIKGVDIKGGIFLASNNLFLADSKGKRCVICDTKGVLIREVRLPETPWGVFSKGKEILVTIPDRKRILKIDSTSFEIKETIPVGCCCFGIAMSGNTAVIGTDQSIDIFPGGFDAIKRKTSTDDFIFGVAINDENNVICISYTQHIVKKLDLQGNVLFTYHHNKLKNPFGVDTDNKGNIFFSGNISYNIHILSRDGKLLRIVTGVENPTWIKFQNATNRLLVGSSASKVKVFEFTEN